MGHLYRVDAFFLAKNVAELAQYLLYPIVFSSIVYWMSGEWRETQLSYISAGKFS